ncbi:hypothetical protein RN001_004621 [Aquatica leii]|uniref:Uncharacterized protein n=1 Tax=Aquatica leii TaxID=1421715 RepID=A0AAN7Q041_9COLE|nr:hypothetical protein RN001_004621 [Aquatica leii]
MKTYSRKKPGETQEVILHLNELCRLCMSKEDVLVPIFNDDEPIPLTLRIMACVQLEVFEGDGLPNRICPPCKYQLEKSYAFRKKCEQSDMKLRHHLKMLQEKIGEIEISDEESENVKTEASHSAEVEMCEEIVNKESEPSTEQDLVGVAQVAYIDPTPDAVDENSEHITLPMETDHINKKACTLVTQMEMKKEEDLENNYEREESEMGDLRPTDSVYIMDNDNDVQEQQNTIEDQDLEAIADAVKATLASHPGFDITGELQMKVDSQPGKPTQVQVTTEDGSILVMELMTEDDTEGESELQVQDINDDGELKIFRCPDCPKSFSRRIQLRRHASVHMQQRGFSCGICEKWFPTRSALVRHERIHTGERPFQCEVCQKSFAQKEILFRHLMTHTGQKPYNCPHCPKGFTQKEPLRVHMRTHLNPNPTDIQLHYCTLCPKVFCHASGLSRHLITHTGKTFKCRDCDKSFTDKSSLRRHHRQTMHQE